MSGPAAGGGKGLLCTASAVGSIVGGLANPVVTVSLRQQIVPAGLLGRVNSVYRMIGWGLMPAGPSK